MARKRIQKSKTLKKTGGVWYRYLRPKDDIIKIGTKTTVTESDLEKVKDIIDHVSQKERIFEELYAYISKNVKDFDNSIKLYLYSESKKNDIYSSCLYDASDIKKIGLKNDKDVTEIDKELIKFFIEKGKPKIAQHEIDRSYGYSGCVRTAIKESFPNFNDTVKTLLTDTTLIKYKEFVGDQLQSHQSQQYTPQPQYYQPQQQQYTPQPQYQQDEQSLDRLSALRDSLRARGQELQKKYPYPVQQSLQQPQPQSQCNTNYTLNDDINDLLDEFDKNPDGVLCLIKEALDNKDDSNDEKISDLFYEIFLMNNERPIDANTFNQIKQLNILFNNLQFHGGKKSKKQRSKSHKKSRKQRRKSS